MQALFSRFSQPCTRHKNHLDFEGSGNRSAEFSVSKAILSSSNLSICHRIAMRYMNAISHSTVTLNKKLRI